MASFVRLMSCVVQKKRYGGCARRDTRGLDSSVNVSVQSGYVHNVGSEFANGSDQIWCDGRVINLPFQ